MKMPKGVGRHQLLSKIEKMERDMKSLKGLISKIEEDTLVVPDNKGEFVKFFCDEWKAKYSYSPKLNGANIGALKNLLKDFSKERAQDMVRAFLKMNDAQFIRRRHDPIALLQNTVAVGHFLDSGKFLTNGDAKEMERTYKAQTLFDMVDNGKL